MGSSDLLSLAGNFLGDFAKSGVQGINFVGKGVDGGLDNFKSGILGSNEVVVFSFGGIFSSGIGGDRFRDGGSNINEGSSDFSDGFSIELSISLKFSVEDLDDGINTGNHGVLVFDSDGVSSASACLVSANLTKKLLMLSLSWIRL